MGRAGARPPLRRGMLMADDIIKRKDSLYSRLDLCTKSDGTGNGRNVDPRKVIEADRTRTSENYGIQCMYLT